VRKSGSGAGDEAGSNASSMHIKRDRWLLVALVSPVGLLGAALGAGIRLAFSKAG
jgi:hypothetical protein